MSRHRIGTALAVLLAVMLALFTAAGAHAQRLSPESEDSATPADLTCTTTTLRPLDVPLEAKVCIRRHSAAGAQAVLFLPDRTPRGLLGPEAVCAAEVDLVDAATGRSVNPGFPAQTGPCSGVLWGPYVDAAHDKPLEVHAVAGVRAYLPGRPRMVGPTLAEQFRPSPDVTLAFATCSTGTLNGEYTNLHFASGQFVEIEFVTASTLPTALQVTNHGNHDAVDSGGPFQGAPWYYTTVTPSFGPAIHDIEVFYPGGGESNVGRWPAAANVGDVGYKIRSDNCFTSTGAQKYDAPAESGSAPQADRPDTDALSPAPRPAPLGQDSTPAPPHNGPSSQPQGQNDRPGKAFTTQRITDGFLVKSKDRPNGPDAGHIDGGPNHDGNGFPVQVDCEAHGPAVDGHPYTVWDRLTDGYWVYGYYLTTPGNGFDIGPIDQAHPGAGGLPLCDGFQ
ncbi:hypothetical protein [Kitasatospora griseola]|uniref:hypothetical protein n=1 Tax=Kitasatospora griseola TaxID=2064 RepID=UPI001670DA4F|nr:hypothetical protein [Kitasatospora griseola]GGR00656.1 hypothetical protein GCM10010195_65570 [Kitasatospora griseola]